MSPAAVITTAPPDDCWFTVASAATWLHCGRRPIYRAIANSELKASPVNGRKDYRIHSTWLLAWMEQRASGGAE